MVKQAAGVLIQSLQAAGDAPAGQRVRVYRTVRDALHSGTLAPGARLPSARQMAADCGVSRGAVDEAFDQLQAEGFIERRVGDGSYVSGALPPGTLVPRMSAPRPPSRSARRVIERFAPHLGQWSRLEVSTQLFKLAPLHPRAVTVDDFPLATWRRLIQRAYADEYRDHLNYGPSAGLPSLREAIARHLRLTRAVACDASQILIVNSPMQAVELIARVLLEPGDRVWLEDPGHASLPVLFDALHMQVTGVPFDARGFDVARGRAVAPDAVAVYLHALAQTPLGVRTDAARCAELLAWAEERSAWVIEGNYNTELVHDGVAPATLYSLDGGERVLLVGTFEGILFASLRLAYLVVPAHLVTVFTAMRGLLGEHSHVASQLALTAFIDEGHMSTHLRLLRQRVRARRDVLREAVAAHVPAWATLGPAAEGMHACLHLPAEIDDLQVLRAVRRLGVGAVTLSSICWHTKGLNGLMLGYGGAGEAAIEHAVRVIGAALADAHATASR